MIAFVDHVIGTARGKKPPQSGTRVAENALSVLRTICSIHVKAGLLTKNPATGSKRIVAKIAQQYDPEVSEIDSWTLVEANRLVEIARLHEPQLYRPLLFLFHTGCRRGEAIGLRWNRVDFERRRVRVGRARVRGHDKGTKNAKSRWVPMSPDLERELRYLAKTRQGREGLDSNPGYVFCAIRGGQWQETTFSRTWWRVRTRAAREGIRPLKLHCTRHTFATVALESGRSIRWVAKILDHSDPALTLRTYAHVLEREDDGMEFLSTAPTPPPFAPSRIEGKEASRAS